MLAVSAHLLLAFCLGAGEDEPIEQKPAEAEVLDTSTVAPPPSPFQYTLGARTEVRSGHPLETFGVNVNPNSATTNLEVDPLAAIRVNFRTGTFAVAYEPRIIIITSYTDSQRVYYLHRGRLSFELRPAPRWSLYVNSRSSFGEYDYNPTSGLQGSQPGTGLPSTPGTGGPPAPPVLGSTPDQQFVKVLNVETSAGVTYALSPVLTAIGSAGYMLNGGADRAAQASVPLQQGPIALAALRWSASRSDTLLSGVDVSHVRFSSGPISTLVNLALNWSHAWSPALSTDLMGGAGAFHSYNVPNQPPESAVLPIGGIGIRHAITGRDVRWRNEFQAVIAPAPDTLSGTVDERTRWLFISTLSFRERVVLSFTGEVGQTLGLDQKDARLEGKITYNVSPQLAIAAGGRAAWLQGYNLPGAQDFGWVGFLTVAGYVGTGP